ncbi:glycogen synthase GlgA [Paenibacillus sp. Aloe-11]|uniref:glycogen synthase GlgA n=1 Tax=Paenibacillus sp. Aloe-11 TaxID=1050222 RepID=UPI00024EF7C9|nr:glycogen synthase GlgA [Paenibacillus sp. Aloe-11]EHS55680.1 glycogen/starch synthase, ADP-glucose type [Paenibacillus sp. Aloe-11]
MNILFAAAEAHPFIKTGGLADVIGALPKALRQAGCDVRIILPKYAGIPDTYKSSLRPVTIKHVPVGWREQYCGVEELTLDGIKVYFIDNEYYFGREGVYGYMDDGERFSFFNRAVLEILPDLDFRPDILHCHDWHTAMVPLLLHADYRHLPFYSEIRTVFTIHNLLYQGDFPYEVLTELLNLDGSYFTPEGVEYYGRLNFMKGGLTYSDHVTTVSPTYAEEIQTEFYGYGLEGLLHKLGEQGCLSGIVNGIDTTSYNPATDNRIYTKYRTSLAKKKENKIGLQKELGLPIRSDVPLMAMVTRLVDMKGLDLVTRVLDEILYYDDIQFVVLGTGDPAFEHWFREAAGRHPARMSAQLTFSEPLSRKIYAASDMFLMPSRFEPCGISQLLALRYGSIPIVRETGGLNDTVQAYNESTGEGNGFSFTNYNAHDMLHTIRRAVDFYRLPEHWSRLTQTAFAGEYSWDVSAEAYMDIYRSLTKSD